jgi:hypothetical protein
VFAVTGVVVVRISPARSSVKPARTCQKCPRKAKGVGLGSMNRRAFLGILVLLGMPFQATASTIMHESLDKALKRTAMALVVDVEGLKERAFRRQRIEEIAKFRHEHKMSTARVSPSRRAVCVSARTMQPRWCKWCRAAGRYSRTGPRDWLTAPHDSESQGLPPCFKRG